MEKRFFLFLAFCVCLSFIGCTNHSPKPSAKINVTTTTGMIADLVRQVGGEHVDVTALMGPGVDPHLYKASTRDVIKLDEADLIIYNGLQLEGKMTHILKKIGKHKPVIAIAERIDRKRLIPIGHQQYDPHIWFDVSLWMEATKQVEQALTQVDPKHAPIYQKRAKQYHTQLQKLHHDTKQKIASIPKEQRILVTAHDAFGYMERTYGLQVVALQGLSTASEFGLKDVQNLVNFIVQRKIKTVFLESSIPNKSLEAVISGAKAKNWQVNIGGELYSDALGSPGSKADTYIKMVRYNVETIVSSLK